MKPKSLLRDFTKIVRLSEPFPLLQGGTMSAQSKVSDLVHFP